LVLKGTSINPHAHKSTAYLRTCIHRWALKEAMFRDYYDYYFPK